MCELETRGPQGYLGFFFFATLYQSKDSPCVVCRPSINFTVGIMHIRDGEPGPHLGTEHPEALSVLRQPSKPWNLV